MIDCPDCTEAAKGRPWPVYANGCQGCEDRALSTLATLPSFHRSRREGRLNAAYTRALELHGLTHEQVRDFTKRETA